MWGTENFGTNWGIIAVTPVVGITLFGIIFAIVYDNAARAQQMLALLLGAYYHGDPTLRTGDIDGPQQGELVRVFVKNSNLVCYGRQCYETTYWIMGASVCVACLCWLWAWKGRGGWVERKVNI